LSDPDEGGGDPPAAEGDDPAPDQGDEEQEAGDLPDIEEDERADIDLSGVDTEAVEREAGAGDPDEEADDQGDQEGDADPDIGGAAPSVSWGDKYVELLGVMLVAIVEEVDEDPETDDLGDEIEALATQPPVNLDEQVDRLLAEYGGPDEMSPQQAVLFSTGIVSVTVLAKETDLAGDLAGELLDGGQPA
jgi:hypothetical protein